MNKVKTRVNTVVNNLGTVDAVFKFKIRVKS